MGGLDDESVADTTVLSDGQLPKVGESPTELQWLQRFGAAVRNTRIAMGLTLDEATSQCGVHARHLQKIETGVVSPGITTVLRIASGFGVDVTELLPARTIEQPLADGAPPSSPEAPSQTDTLHRIGLKIRQARITAHLSQRELAERASISAQYLQRIEAGRQSMAVLVLLRVAAALKLRPSAFLE